MKLSQLGCLYHACARAQHVYGMRPIPTLNMVRLNGAPHLLDSFLQVYKVAHADEVASNISRAIGEVRGAHFICYDTPGCSLCSIDKCTSCSAVATFDCARIRDACGKLEKHAPRTSPLSRA